MLIEFSVANFRSVKNTQRLSMAAGSSPDVRKRHSFESGVRQAPYVLRAAAIYGANASGKTTLVKALDFARQFILGSARDREPGAPIAVTPFLRSAVTSNQPSHFELVFAFSGAVYQLGFTVDSKRVWSEWLFVTPKGKNTQRWIERDYNLETGEYETYVNPAVPGERKTWISSTRPDALLFSTAVQLNAKSFEWPHHWIRSHLRVIRSPQRFSSRRTIELIEEGKAKDVLSFLGGVGLDVSDIKTKEAEPLDEEVIELFSGPLREFAVQQSKRQRKVLFGHGTEEGDVVFFPLEEESDGTKILFSLAGPWLDVCRTHVTLVVDELHNSLHPFALRYLLDRYFTSDAIGGGQLIFTTHETYAMDEMSLHRDQVWFVNRGPSGSSTLTPLSDYKVRSKEAYRTGYLRGRYGGLPFFPALPRASSEHKANPVDESRAAHGHD